MIEIRNFHLIAEKIHNFRENHLRQLVSLKFYDDFDEYFEEVSFLEIEFIYVDENKRRYPILLKFHDVTSLHLKGLGGGENQLTGFKITDMKDRDWELARRYNVHDYEDDTIEFYCRTIEVLQII